MAFTDLHCHTFFKPNWLLGDVKTLLQQNIDIQIDPNHRRGIGNILLRLFSGGLKEILNSQSSLRQVHEGKGAIIVMNMTAMENAYANLDFCFFKKVFQFIENINREQLTKLGNNQLSYSDIIHSELKIIQDFNGVDLGGMTYKIINHFDEIDNSGNVINVILAIEGGHGFYTRNDVFDQENNPQEIIEALIDWKIQAKSGTKPRLLYITPTHHAANCLANHAFAVPPDFAGNGINSKAGGFNPVANGITEKGEEFMKIALRKNQSEDRILIDIKHLSLRSRLQYYEIVDSLNAEDAANQIPIVASHFGVTGLSWTDSIVNTCSEFEADDKCYSVHYDESLWLHGFKISDSDSPTNEKHIQFNPWSINLFNEEIMIIIRSKGLIGLSFDSRILGNETVAEERFSKIELQPLLSIEGIDFRQKDEDNNYFFLPTNHISADDTRYPNDSSVATFRFNSFNSKSTTDLLALCQNIIHIVRIGGNDAWNRICIGSDFDGIINPIDCANDASRIPDMKNDFKKYIKLMAKMLNDYFIEKETGESPIIVPNDFYEKFISENANHFLAVHF